MKSLDPLYTQSGSAHHQQGDKEGEGDLKGNDDSPQCTGLSILKVNLLICPCLSSIYRSVPA